MRSARLKTSSQLLLFAEHGRGSPRHRLNEGSAFWCLVLGSRRSENHNRGSSTQNTVWQRIQDGSKLYPLGRPLYERSALAPSATDPSFSKCRKWMKMANQF